ncbi:MAG TPA: hypothetical protein VK862_09940 [Afifellaceae bacterium]|nr:hypothetical protein [Afifellaceae bacterium]
MTRFARLALLATLGLAATAGSAFADSNISCPLSQARRTITDNLPSGWWTTPIVNRLSDTKVQNIGGEPALICVYGSSGSVQRKAPRGETCTAVGRGFRCVSARPAGPSTFSTGPINVRQTFQFDLDRGRVQPSGADLWFQAETRDLLYLVPRNGASIGVGDRSNRGYAGCSSARMSTNRVSLRDIPVGSYVCVKTNEGRISQFRVNGLSAGSPKTLSLGYTTWQ